VIRAGVLAGLSRTAIRSTFPITPSFKTFSRSFCSQSNADQEQELFPPLDPKKSPKGLPAEYFNVKAGVTPLVLLPNDLIEEKLQYIRQEIMKIQIQDIVKKNKYEILKDLEDRGVIKITPQLIKMIDEHEFDEDFEGLNFWELMSGGVVGVIILIILYLIVFPPEHPVRPSEYPYLRIRAKKYPWGDTDLFDMLGLKIFGWDKYAHHGHGHDDHDHDHHEAPSSSSHAPTKSHKEEHKHEEAHQEEEVDEEGDEQADEH